MIQFNETEKLNKIKEVVETLRIYIQQDGGDMKFIEYRHPFVTIGILGACIGCNLTNLTYEAGLQQILREEVDQEIVVKLVVEIN